MGSSQAPRDPVHHEAAGARASARPGGRWLRERAARDLPTWYAWSGSRHLGLEELGSAAVGHTVPLAQPRARQRGRASRLWLAPLRISSLPVLALEFRRVCTGEPQLSSVCTSTDSGRERMWNIAHMGNPNVSARKDFWRKYLKVFQRGSRNSSESITNLVTQVSTFVFPLG